MDTVSFRSEIWFTLPRDRCDIGVMKRTTLIKVCVGAVHESALINLIDLKKAVDLNLKRNAPHLIGEAAVRV